MHNSKLLRSLRRCSRRELSRFEEFLASPYFNKQASNIAFFEWLRKFAPHFSHADLSLKGLQRVWPPDEDLDQKKLNYLLSQLNGLLEQFLVSEQLTSDGSFVFYQLLRQKARTMGIDHLEQRSDQKLGQFLDKPEFQDSLYYQQLYQVQLDRYMATDPYDRAFNPKLQTAADTLDIYYAISRLRFAWQMRHLEAVSPGRYEHHLEAGLLSWLEDHDIGTVPAVAVYRAGLKMLSEPETTAHYFAFKAGLQEQGAIFPPAERKLLYTGLLNYCVRRSNQYGDAGFMEEFLEVNELLMREGLLLEDGRISPWRYVNLKMAALRVSRDDWAWEFIHDYREFLPETYRENVFRYALAYLYFYRKDYDRAQQLLIQVQFEDLLFNVALRTLLVRVYFEAGEIETLLIPQLEANRLFLIRRRQELAPRLYEQWRNFNKFCGHLAKLDERIPSDCSALQAQIDNTELLLHKDWLIAQINKFIVF